MENKSQKKVLIIEDDQSLASAYRIKLSPYFVTQNAITGDEGLKDSHDWKPDLIVLDLFIPVISVQYVLKEIKKDAKTNHIPFIDLTNLEGQFDQMTEGGAVECLIKTEMTMEE